MRLNGFLLNVIKDAEKSLGTEVTYRELFRILSESEELKRQDERFNFWTKQLKELGLRLPVVRKGYERYFMEYIPSETESLLAYLNTKKRDENVNWPLTNALLLTKRQRLASIKLWFNETNKLGLRCYEHVEKYFNYSEYEYVYTTYALIEEGIYSMTTDNIIDFDRADTIYVRAFEFTKDEDSLKDRFFSSL